MLAVDAAIVESRLDDARKTREITELLVAGGYHRARFEDAPAFDRILGGLAWGCRACGRAPDVEVDLALDVANASVGQKISLCERVEEALRRMGAPRDLRAHQIRGLDAEAILPVARWLVRMVLETRERTGDRLRMYSRFVYRRIDGGVALEEEVRWEEAEGTRRALRDEYGSRRAFRRASGREPPRDNPARWAKSVMMEYGHKLAGLEAFASAATAVLAASRWKRKTRASKAAGTLRGAKKGDDSEDGVAALVNKVSALAVERDEDEEVDEDEAAAANELSALQSLESELAAHVGSDTLTNAMARAILSASGGKEILAAAEKFGSDVFVGGEVGQMLALERKVAAMERKLAAELATADEARQRAEAAQAEVTSALEELEKVTSYNAKCEEETSKLDESVTDPEQREAVARLVELMKRAASSKTEEKAFKAECKKRMVELKKEIERGGEHTLTEEERAQIEEVEATHALERQKYESDRAMLSKRSRAVSLLNRKLEDIPSRAELIQYERRFEELYDTVQAKLKETRKYFAQYNVLADTKKYLQKEISILNSIHQQVRPALETVRGKSSLVTALASIEDGVAQNIRIVEEKLAAELAAADDARRAHDDALRTQRRYATLVRDLRDAAKRESELRAAAHSPTTA